jgi:cysteine dioxygenase
MKQVYCTPQTSFFTLDQLKRIAREYPATSDLPVRFGEDSYARITLYRDERLEVALVCFAGGQTTSVHDHQGSNCVLRVVRGKIMESQFRAGANGQLDLLGSCILQPGDVTGLDGEEIHHVCNLDPSGTVLLNFYSPPFKV